jgi:hypothetical protein
LAYWGAVQEAEAAQAASAEQPGQAPGRP